MMSVTVPARMPFRSVRLTEAILALAAVILAAEPIRWLIETWRDPSYDSQGVFVAAVVLCLAACSLASPSTSNASETLRRKAFRLIALSALTRLIGQNLAINTIGALTLVIDVYAIGVLSGLDRRRFAIAPFWLAVGFAFVLPLERVAQRSIGYLLQSLSADGACRLLSGLFEKLECHGVRLVVDGRDVLVDLPCSGARTILFALLGFTLLASVQRPSTKRAIIGIILTVCAAVAANILRIAILAIGIARPEAFGGLDVMAEPAHGGIGIVALMLALLPAVWWLRNIAPRARAATVTDAMRGNAGISFPSAQSMTGSGLPLSLATLAIAVIIITLPSRPIDVARKEAALELPRWISGEPGTDVPLLDKEHAYFTRFGGAAAKRQFGPHGLMLVRTSSPLRHLHAPEECLRGLGFQVRYLGITHAPLPSAAYLATSADGTPYRIDVTFVSERGHTTTNVATAVWHWLRGEARVWTAIQRISPATLDTERHLQWSAAAIHALALPILPATVKGVER